MHLQRYNDDKYEIERKEVDQIEYGWNLKVLDCIYYESDKLHYLVFEWLAEKNWKLFVPITEKVYNTYHKIEEKEV